MTPTQLTMGEEEMCNTSLGLGIGNEIVGRKESDRKKNKSVVCLDLSFPLCLKEEEDIDDRIDDACKDEGSISSKTIDEDERAREQSNSCITKNNNNNNYGSRKKLRLTKEQSTLLEDSFKLHTTLNTGQKQALAEKLNLLPRQVEVWFQNRRARTKLKQTEVDCEFLKKCCESLSDENRRLKKELQDLRSFKLEQLPPPPHSPSSIPLPNTTTMSICSSCEKTVKGVVKSGGGGRGEGLKIGSAVNNEADRDSKVCKINTSEQL